MKFSIWYNQDDNFFNLLDKNKLNIHSVYFAAPLELIPSWRDKDQWEQYEKEIFRLLSMCNKYWIETILVLNATCEWENTWDKYHMLKIISYIKKLEKIWLKSISLTNLLYVRFIKSAFPDIKIYSSVNCYLKNVEQAIYMKNIWVDVLTIDRDINRDLDLIKEIKKRTWLKIQILLNEWCIRNCPYRNTHFNIISHKVENNERNIKNWKYNLLEKYSCYPLLLNNRRILFRIPFIRPEDLHYYDWVCDVYKLNTRDETTETIYKMMQAYTNWYYHWNLLDICSICIIWYEDIVTYIDNDKLTKYNFFEDLKKCTWDCDSCNNCDKYFDD